VWHDTRLLNGIANALLGLVLLALLASGVWWLAHRPMFVLRQIGIESMGNGSEFELRHVNELTIRGTALPKLRGNFFTSDLDVVRQAFEAVPWVRRASVRREWPNRLVVALEEHQVMATWGEDEGRLLSVKGELFTANLAEAEDDLGKDSNLPQLSGPPGTEKEVLARYSELRQWFEPLNLIPEELALSNRYAWRVKLDSGTTVELGREQNGRTLKERVQRLIEVHPKLMQLANGKIESVDMRYPNGLAVKSSNLNITIEQHPVAKSVRAQAAPKKRR
jgi:cell division protein FtsQ